MKIHPLILLGGAGGRLWPISRNSRTKAFLSLGGEKSLASRTIARFNDARFAAPVLLASQEDRSLLSGTIEEAGVAVQQVILEPRRRNTAPAIAAGLCAITEEENNALILVAPSDHLIADQRAFYDAVDRASCAARAGYITTFGAAPTSAQTGYGYIEKGAPFDSFDGVNAIKSFVEKPSAALAKEYIATDRFLWNSGIFLFRKEVMVAQFEIHAPDILKAARRAFEGGARDQKFLLLAENFSDLPDAAFDRAIMEKTDQGAVVEVDMGWRDLGSWRSVGEVLAKDENGNAIIGGGEARDSRNCLIWNDTAASISVLGVDDLVIIAVGDRVLVVSKEQADRVWELRKDGLKKDELKEN